MQTTGEVADLLGVSVPTVRRTALQLGLVDERTRGGHRRFAPGEVQLLVGRLGITPRLGGFTPHEVKVLAAFARQPVGFRSARAAARASRVSPTTAIAAIDTLCRRGLIRAEVETVAEGTARDVTVYRLNPGTEWSKIASTVSQTVPPNTLEAPAPPSRVPRHFWHLFWNVEPSRLRLPAQERFVANRMLLSHDPTAWAWAAQNLSEPAIRSVRHSRGVDGPTGAMIDNILASAA